MSITYTIPGATLLDQLNPATLDGLPNNDANDNCVGTSVAEGLHIETSKTYDGDEVKDAAYDPNYVGTESAARYVSYCAAQGVQLHAINASQAGLIAEIHSQVSAGHPVLVSMPSDWATPEADPVHPSGSTHVGIAVGVGPGEIRVMNPWHGFWQDESDAWWQARLCYGQVWPMQKVSSNVSSVPSGWKDDGTTLVAPNGKTVVQGFRTEVLNWPGGWEADNQPLEEAAGQTPASMGLGGAHATRQTFAYRMLGWSDTDGVRVIWLGVMFLRDEGAIASLTGQVAQEQTATQVAQGQRDALSAQLAAAQAQVASLTAQLAAAQAAPPMPPAPPPAPAPTPQDRAALDLVAALKAAMSV
jgi:hypothetical protein